MKAIITIVITILCISSLFAQQPVTITPEDVPSMVGTDYELKLVKGVTTTVNLGEAGANKTWDLTGFEFNVTENWEVVDINDTPFVGSFPDANLVYKVTNSKGDTITYNYVRLLETGVSEVGQAKTLGGDTTFLATPNTIDPKTNFPVTYGDEPWTSVPEYESSVTYLGTDVDVLARDSSYFEVDGWGMVKTELGDIECLRVKQFNVRDVFIKQFNLWLRGFEIYVLYNWVAPEYGFVATIRGLNQQTDENFTEASQVSIMTLYTPVGVENTEQENIVRNFELHQNFPNPFNPLTHIKFELPEAADVKITVYNALGEQVTVLLNDRLSAGMHTVQWNALNEPSGVYFYELKTNQSTLRKKALLLK
ncbi:T9SS type A sorting domain-containing protein [candidate division KSB1 bacterium]|nr:T9SS type A sorting domain-containing protein [candidate division KSB1 bacterium]